MRFAPLFLSAVLTCLPALAMAEELLRTLVVTGEGQVSVEPDMAVLNLGVSHEAMTAKAAMDATSQEVGEVLETLAAAGLEGRDVQTASVSLSPRWDHRNRDEPPRVVGYVASNTLTIRVRDLGELGGVLDRVVGSGANQMNGLSFTLAEPRPAQDQARVRAVEDALAKARLLADAAGVTLGPIRQLSEGGGRGPAPEMLQRGAMAMEASVPIATGEVDVRAMVTVVFDILP